MKGSEKQIRWAEDLRTMAGKTLDAMMAELKAEADAQQAAELDAAAAWIMGHDDARWWIDEGQPGAYVGDLMVAGLKATDAKALAGITSSFCGSRTLDGRGRW